MSESQQTSGSIKAVVIYELIKGISAIVAASMLWLWHSQILESLERITEFGYKFLGGLFAVQIDVIVDWVQKASQNWQMFMYGIFAYASIRFVEAYGLWRDKVWAYWFSVLGYGVFIPVEVYYLISKPFDWFKLFVLILNILVVTIVYRQILKKGLL